MSHRPYFRFLRLVTPAALLMIAACDEGVLDEETAQERSCDLADEACAALPAAADALALLESMGVDLDTTDVELVVGSPLTADIDPTGEPSDAFGLTTEAPDPQAQKSTCNGEGSTLCCCYWDGPWWGCVCFG